MDFGISGRSWNQPPMDTEGLLYTVKQYPAFQSSFIINTIFNIPSGKADVLRVDEEQSSGKPAKVSQS